MKTSTATRETTVVNHPLDRTIISKSRSLTTDLPSTDLAPESKQSTSQAIKSSRSFKVALIASYVFLTSVFSAIVYIADLLDPRFPF